MSLFGNISQTQLMGYLVRLFIIFMILPIHEFAHAWTAHKLGDDTANLPADRRLRLGKARPD